VLGVLLSAGITVAAPTASAKVVIGQSIAGVKLGATEAQVRRLVGKPSACEPCSKSERLWRYARGFEGIIIFDSAGRVKGMWTGSEAQATSKGIHANGFSGTGHGSSLAEIKQAYPSAKCEEMPNSDGYATCDLISHYHGRKVDTNFLIKAASAGVAEIAVDFV
ncbi:MAG TPA: hypothetical protein VNV37_08395, partial [Solirubrobacteraceae bacterium]|nr:hypothetical protein [Solirubrobacteraceae bacterium]